MSTTTYYTSGSFPRRNIRTSSRTIAAMTNDTPRFPLRTNHFSPIPPIRESVSTSIKPSLPSARNRSHTNEESSKQIYTFSNPPRELQRNRKSSFNSHIRQRVSSAPDENSFQNSPRLRLNQPKSSSANVSLTPRSHDDRNHPSIRAVRDEQEKYSLNALMKKQEKSKVPKSVQKRRIVLLFHRSSPRQEQNSSPMSDQSRESPNLPNIISTPSQTSQPSDSFDNIEPELADSMQLAAILANIQLQDDWNPNETSSRHQQAAFDPSKYEYVVASPLDTATFKLSPRTLKPDEELAARLRFSQYYRYEMRSSANAELPPLMASIVTENNNTIGYGTDMEQTFTFKLNSTDATKKQSSLDDGPLESTMDNELVQLCYDATLKRFYDPDTGKYYELTSA